MTTDDGGNAATTGGPGDGNLPIYTRNATGLVREVSLVDHLIFNFTSATALVSGLVVTSFVVAVFPGANYLVSMVLALLLSLGVWACIALLTATLPKVGGDYVFNSRILHPALGFGLNLCVVAISPLTAGLVAGFIATLGLSPAFAAIGSVTGSETFTDWSAALTFPHKNAVFIAGTLGVLGVSILAALGTRILIRTMTILILVFAGSAVIDLLILAFTSRDSFEQTYNDFAGAGAYQGVVDAAKGSGLLPSESGYDFKATIGALFFAITIITYCFWGTYLSAEVRRAGQRDRMLKSFIGGGLIQSLSLIVGWVLMLKAVGEDFFISATAGNIETGFASFPFFAALVAGQDFIVIILSLAFTLWIIPGININMAVVQRGLFAYAFDGLLPKRVASVHPRTHTPVVAIAIVACLSEIGVALYAYWADIITIVTIISYFPLVALFFVGVSAMLMQSRRPDIYNGSPADWRLGGLPMLRICGALTSAAAAFAIFLVFYFQDETGLAAHPWWAAFGPVLVVGFGIAWWFAVREYRRRAGVDLDLLYRTIPPD
ncbi:MAG: basic amino acid/polyamine antiporter, family [Gaiellales bacterium]|jgi:amino acid transporter|nr:basic amino acid/polyamine antiporter, family [Gaiellales bacterium]MDX6593251.1 basic amino acid/polyamine antiporter, family [Gaiellales bacterium]